MLPVIDRSAVGEGGREVHGPCLLRMAKGASGQPPTLFTCPISLELMKDPVTLSTGQTYDRHNIERWFEAGHSTCPTTMQLIKNSSCEMAPNKTLQRLIQQWCVSNNYRGSPAGEGQGVEEAKEESNVVGRSWQQRQEHMQELLRSLVRSSSGGGNVDVRRNLKELSRLVAKRGSIRTTDANRENRKILREVGGIPILVNFVFSPENLGGNLRACEEALGILTLLPLHGLRKAVKIGNRQLTAMSWLLNRGSLDGRVNAALFLGAVGTHDPEMKAAVGVTAGVFEGLVQLLKEDLCKKVMEAGLKTLLTLLTDCPDDKNMGRALKAGLVFAVAELLPEAEKKNKVRAMTRLLELLCSYPAGQKALSAHALSVPVLARIVGLGDTIASEKAVWCLWTLCRCAPESCIEVAAGQSGLLTHLSRMVDATGSIQEDRSGHLDEVGQRAADLLFQLRYRLENCDFQSENQKLQTLQRPASRRKSSRRF